MFQRPKANETEEDLIRQEEEFLKHSGKSATRKRIHNAEGVLTKSSKSSSFIGEVVEKNRSSTSQIKDPVNQQPKGFPLLFYVNTSVNPGKKSKKSLFAMHMEKNRKIPPTIASTDECSDVMDCQESDNLTRHSCSVVTREKEPSMESIHEENLKKLSNMTEEEILEAQRKLYETLDPKLIELLKNRSKPKIRVSETEVKNDMEVDEAEAEDEDFKEKLSNYVGEKWVNMDFVEKDKLEWVGDIPDAKALEPNKPYSARFDFRGELQPFLQEKIDVTKSLHHHGEEPERPGYTIQELYQLSRSSVLQQRILALNTLANIIRKTKLGYYDVCFDGFLLHKLLESDLFLLLRFSMDENALIPSSINCLRRLLYNDTDEYCLDKLLGIGDDVQPLLFNKIEANEDEENELKDNTIINCDIIKGVLRTDLLIRITYVLNNLKCDRETTTNAILCFIRISRHSIESAREILKTNFLDFACSVIKCQSPIYQAVKLFRLLIGYSKELAEEILNKYSVDFILNFINIESMIEISRSEFYLLKLESVYLWRHCIKYGFMVEEFMSWTPCMIRLLSFYVEKIDLCGEGDFDFELFSGMLSLLRLCVRKKLSIDANYMALLHVCLEKWLKQLLHFSKFNYAGLKALGTCFGFFTDYFQNFGIDQLGIKFMKKIHSVISDIVHSSIFDQLCENLIHHSHVLTASFIKRDPKNLPSLCSVYEEGRDFLKIVNSQSPLPFFTPFILFLKYSNSISREFIANISLIMNCTTFRRYVTKITKLKKNHYNWFSKYEHELLVNVLKLFELVRDKETLRLGFRLLPMMRVDDENAKIVLSIITSKTAWNEEFFDNTGDLFSNLLCKLESKSGSVLYYQNELIEEDWMFRIFYLLRGKEATSDIGKILKFISHILDKNPNLLDRVSYTVRYHHLCSVFMTDSNVFDDEIITQLQCNFQSIIKNKELVQLEKKVDKTKSFYDLYTELITQYAGVSYGLHIFAKFVLFPLQNRFDISFRKLIWFEYHHVLRVITLPYPVSDFLDLEDFTEPCETDESLLVAYLNSVATNTITKNRNPFVYNIALGNVRKYLKSTSEDSKLVAFLKSKIETIKNQQIKLDLLS